MHVSFAKSVYGCALCKPFQSESQILRVGCMIFYVYDVNMNRVMIFFLGEFDISLRLIYGLIMIR
jgi:hypothetical protein